MNGNQQRLVVTKSKSLLDEPYERLAREVGILQGNILGAALDLAPLFLIYKHRIS